MYIILGDHDPQVCEPDTPLTYETVFVQKLERGDTYDIIHWEGGQSQNYYNVTYINGIPRQLSPYNP